MWKVLQSTIRKIHRFTIAIDEIELTNKEHITFSYAAFASGVCILPITHDGRVVVIQQYRHPVKSLQWELPAGAIDAGESPLEAAKRELKEETGYTAKSWIDLGSFYPSPGSTSEEIFLFAATGLEKGSQKLDSTEQIRLNELSQEELKALIKTGEFKHGGGLAAILRYNILCEK
jgi:ADP-ribose pyrophosphatase